MPSSRRKRLAATNRQTDPRANSTHTPSGRKRARTARKGTGAADKPKTQAAPSSHRARKDAAGPCPLMHECGGCLWLGMPYKKQLARKQETIDELMAPLLVAQGWDAAPLPILGMRTDIDVAMRASGYDPLRDGTVTAADGKLPAPRAFRYKAATPFAPGPDGAVRAGFYARGTHDIVAVPACAVEAPGARHLLNEIARLAAELGIPAYDEDRRQGTLRYAVLRCGWRRNEAMLTLVTAQRDVPALSELARALTQVEPRLVSIAQNINGRVGNAILGSETHIVWGAPCMRDELLGCTFEISPTAFYQTNPQQTEVLYRLALDGMDLRDGDTLVDAYCGSGTIGITAAHAARQAGRNISLIGVERNPSGIADAARNAELNGLSDRCSFVAEDATSYLKRAAGEGLAADVIVLDPPRAGSTPEFLAAAAAIGPRRIVYVSCNPATQVRDLAELGRAGYRPIRLTPVDMFPHTDHIETVAVLERA